MSRKPTAAERRARRRAKVLARGDDAMKTLTQGLSREVPEPAKEEEPAPAKEEEPAPAKEEEPAPQPEATLRRRRQPVAAPPPASPTKPRAPSPPPAVLPAPSPSPTPLLIIQAERKLLQVQSYESYARFLLSVAMAALVALGWCSDVHAGSAFVALQACLFGVFSTWRRQLSQHHDKLDVSANDLPGKISQLLSVGDQAVAVTLLNSTLGWLRTLKRVLDDFCLFLVVYAVTKSTHHVFNINVATMCPFFARMAAT